MANPYRVGIELSMASNHAQVLGALSRSLLGVYPLVSQLTQHFDQLKLAIGGALSIAVGGEFLSILGHITEKTKGLSHEMTQLRKLGLTEPEVTRAQAEAVRITKAVPGTTELDALKILGQTYSVLGSENIKVAEALAKFENVIKNSADKLGATDQKQLYQAIRSADLIGKLTDPTTHQVNIDVLTKYLDLLSKVTLATEGRVTPQTWLNMAQQGGPALMNLDQQGLLTMGIMSQMMGGWRAGTAMMSLFQQMAGGMMPKRTAIGMQELGLLGPDEWRSGGGGGAGGGVILTEEASKRLSGLIQKDPLQFAETIKKLMEDKGITSNEEQIRSLFRILGRQTTQRFTADELRNMTQIIGERLRIQGALPTDAAMAAQNKGDVAQNMRNLQAAWDNLQFAIAGPNTENTIAVLHALTGAINAISGAVRDTDPNTVKLFGAGIAGLGAAFVGAGAVALLAAIGTGGWLIGGIAGLGAALAALKASGILDTFDTELNKSIEARHKAIVDALSSFGNWLYEGLVSALNAVMGKLKSFLPSWLTGASAADRLKLEQLGGTVGGVAPPTGVLQKPGAWSPGTSIDASRLSIPGAIVAPPSGGTSGFPPFLPMSLTPEDKRDDITNAIHAAAWMSTNARDTKPVVVSLNIDGRRISEALSSTLAQLMEFPNQAPYHDSFGGYAPPDQQFAST